MHKLISGDCLKVLPALSPVKMAFADPPDGIRLKYEGFSDRMKADEYQDWLGNVVSMLIAKADITWISFNYRWLVAMGEIVGPLLRRHPELECRPCTQVVGFGQHNHRDLANGHRPLWRLRWKDASLYPDQIREPSWRQKNGDKRADPRGRVPDDVFRFERVTGNSKQRRSHHPTQLHEGLVERCVKLSTKEGDRVFDVFSGTGTTLRVCKRLNRPCTSLELGEFYCEKIAEENELVEGTDRVPGTPRIWHSKDS